MAATKMITGFIIIIQLLCILVDGGVTNYAHNWSFITIDGTFEAVVGSPYANAIDSDPDSLFQSFPVDDSDRNIIQVDLLETKTIGSFILWLT